MEKDIFDKVIEFEQDPFLGEEPESVELFYLDGTPAETK